jgi:NTE family protein
VQASLVERRSAAERRRGPAPKSVLAIASVGAALAFLDATIVNIAFPDIVRSFPDASISSLSWVLNAYNIVFAAFLVAAGRLADLIGRRRVFVVGLQLFTFASLLCALAPSAGLLIAARVVQALGAAFLVPSSLALVLDAFPPERRSHGVALLSAVAAVAAGLGPSLGGLLIAVGDWRLVFLVNLPIGIAGAVLARRRLVESRAPGRRRMPDLAGAVLFALAIAALILGVVKGGEWGWTDARTLGAFVLAGVLGAAFAWRSTRHRAPLVDLSLLRVRTFTAANSMTIVTGAGFYGYTLTNVLFLTLVWRYSVLEAGLALTPGPFVAAAVAGPTSRLALRIGYRPVLVAGGLVWGGAVLWLVARVGAAPDFLGEWLPGIVLLGIGAGTLLPNLSAAAVASVPGHDFATATGLNSVARQVGAAFGVALVVAIVGTPSPTELAAAFDDAWTFGAICLFAAGAGCLLVGRVDMSQTPALGDAARMVLGPQSAGSPGAAPAARARRAMVVDPVAVRPERPQSASDFLAQVPLFAGLEPAVREDVARRARSVRLAAGEWLFREGDPGDAMFVVQTGRLDVVDQATGLVLRVVGRGDALGELALLDGSPRAASVRAARASDLLAIGRAEFEELLRGSPALPLALTRILGRQLREVRAPAPTIRPRPATVALVPLDDRVPAADLAHRLVTALGGHVSTVLLDGGEIAPPAGRDAGSAYGPLLDRAEADNGLVVMHSRHPGDGWREFCLQQADRIVVLTGGGPLPDGLQLRPELRGCDLVAYDVAPGAGALEAWTTALDPIESHIVRRATFDDDVARAARRLSGRSVGLVLSGGGARAFAHIGVIEELEAAGVTIDRVAGVSMGAFVGALYAMGLDAGEIDARCFEEWVQRRPLSDYTLPRHALIRGERAETMLRRTFGTLAVEELDRSFICACAELRSGRLVVLRSGPLWWSVGVSMSLPILAPPHVRGRELLVDGSLLDNLPVGTLADLGEGPIIAVDVRASLDHTGRPGARAERIPSLGETLMRVLTLGSADTTAAARRHADLVITPRPEGVGLLEFHQLDAAREAGRAAARAALEDAPGELFG